MESGLLESPSLRNWFVPTLLNKYLMFLEIPEQTEHTDLNSISNIILENYNLTLTLILDLFLLLTKVFFDFLTF